MNVSTTNSTGTGNNSSASSTPLPTTTVATSAMTAAAITALSKDDSNATFNTNTTASSLASKYSATLIGENDGVGGGRAGTESPSIGGGTPYATTGNINNRYRAEKKITAKVSCASCLQSKVIKYGFKLHEFKKINIHLFTMSNR